MLSHRQSSRLCNEHCDQHRPRAALWADMAGWPRPLNRRIVTNRVQPRAMAVSVMSKGLPKSSCREDLGNSSSSQAPEVGGRTPAPSRARRAGQLLVTDLVEEGRTVAIAQVQAMHEGKGPRPYLRGVVGQRQCGPGTLVVTFLADRDGLLRLSGMSSHPRRATAVAAASLLAATMAAGPRASADDLRDVVLIGNSASGTVSFLDGHTFQNLGSLNIIPDLQERLNSMTIAQRAAYELVKQQEGGDRFADDVYLSPDGRTLYVSRGNLDDVAAFDIASKTMTWRFQVAGFKADHAALSPDGSRFIVSATTAGEAQVLDTATGSLVTTFPTGTYPHANDYSPDGKYLYNSSIGITTLPKSLESLKGSRQITVVDPATFKVIRVYPFDHGVRPAAFTRDDKTAYLQLSYLNGFVQFDLTTGTITKTVQMPYSAAGQALAPDNYPNNSAHHGMALSGDESRLCDVGTIDDYTAVIARPALTTAGTVTYPTGSIPYWATTSVDGGRCLVTLSGQNAVSVVDYQTSTEIARIPVGKFPQRERLAKAPQSVLDTLSPAAG